jgi:hypothetical protein
LRGDTCVEPLAVIVPGALRSKSCWRHAAGRERAAWRAFRSDRGLIITLSRKIDPRRLIRSATTRL